jgi:hypothetical protein
MKDLGNDVIGADVDKYLFTQSSVPFFILLRLLKMKLGFKFKLNFTTTL